jgi:phosphinothricin acetyltransferase
MAACKRFLKENELIRKMEGADGPEVLRIYGLGIATRNATFEVDLPDWGTWDDKHLNHSRFVFEDDRGVAGWVALSLTSSREAYRGVAEVSIYVDPGRCGGGIGSQLMDAVIRSSEENGIWTLYASIFPENDASVRLHRAKGFRQIGYRERIARLDGQWRDTVLLERRSRVVGN